MGLCERLPAHNVGLFVHQEEQQDAIEGILRKLQLAGIHLPEQDRVVRSEFSGEVFQLDRQNVDDVELASGIAYLAYEIGGEISIGAGHLKHRGIRAGANVIEHCLCQGLVVSQKDELDQPLPFKETHRPWPHIGPPIILLEVVWYWRRDAALFRHVETRGGAFQRREIVQWPRSAGGRCCQWFCQVTVGIRHGEDHPPGNSVILGRVREVGSAIAVLRN